MVTSNRTYGKSVLITALECRQIRHYYNRTTKINTCLAEARTFLFATLSRLILGSTQPHTYWLLGLVVGGTFPKVFNCSMKLTYHLQPMVR